MLCPCSHHFRCYLFTQCFIKSPLSFCIKGGNDKILTPGCPQATGQISNLTAVDQTLTSQLAAVNQLTATLGTQLGAVNQTANGAAAAVTTLTGQVLTPSAAAGSNHPYGPIIINIS